MSFVGTRPEAVKYVEKYKNEYMATLLLPAGITSEASIRYKDEATLQNDAGYLGTTLQVFIEKNKLVPSDLWDNEEDYLWFAKLYPVCRTKEEAVEFAVILSKMAAGEATGAEINRWKQSKRESLCSSFNKADVQHDCLFERELESRILANKFIYQLSCGTYYKEALKTFGLRGISEHIYENLIEDAKNAPEDLKIRIYYALSRYMKENRAVIKGQTWNRS